MQDYLVWAIAGFALVIVELVTGTFYLLVLGGAALVAAAAAFLGAAFWLQCLAGGAAALLGTYFVHRWKQGRRQEPGGANDLDRGQTVVLESWVDPRGGIARVKYRGSSWDARVVGAAREGDVLYIHGQENGMLRVSAAPPQ